MFHRSISAEQARTNEVYAKVQSIGAAPTLGTEARRSMFAIESASVDSMQTLNQTKDQLMASLKDTLNNGAQRFSSIAIEAAAVAAMHASDWKSFVGHKPTSVVSETGRTVVAAMPRSDAVDGRVGPGFRSDEFAIEAYDERENRAAVTFNITYQLGAATQGTFGETLYPTIVMDPTRDAYEVVADLMMVYDSAEHKIDGSITDFMKHNLIRAIANPDILKKNQTRATPVRRAENTDKLLNAAAAAGVGVEAKLITIDNGEGPFQTAPIKTGKKVNLIGLSQTAAAVAQGGYNQTDTLDPYVVLDSVYLRIVNGADTSIIKVKTSNFPYSNFVASSQDNYRRQNLNMLTTSVVITKDTKDIWGAAPAALADVVSNQWLIRLELNVTGHVNIENGELLVTGQVIGVNAFQDANGASLSQSAAPQADTVAALLAGSVIGYDVEAFLTNQNRRRQGQKTDMTRLTQQYRVPMRAPITAMHPAHVDGSVDASDVQQLIQHTRTRVANEAVTALLEYSNLLSSFVDVRDTVDLGPDQLGIGRLYVRAVHNRDTVNMLTIVDSLSSSTRMEDLREALLNQIRNYVYEMHTQSEYAAANEALNGGMEVRPTVVIATDPYIAQFLMTTGDSRTLGPDFEYRVVSTLDRRMKGKLFIAFSVFNDSRNTVPNPLSHGNLLWATELALTANISRGNTLSRETMVQPRYLFVHHLPVLTELTVTNIPAVLSKVAINNNPV